MGTTSLPWRYVVVGAAGLGIALVLGLAGSRWLEGTDIPAADAVRDAAREPVRETPVKMPLAARFSNVPTPQRAVPPEPTLDLHPPSQSLPPSEASPAPGALLPAWQRFAVAAPQAAGRPLIAIVIDDLGHSRARLHRTLRLKAPLTLAFLPYGRDLPALTAEARRAGHEVLVHLPMEAMDPSQDPGPNALLSGLDEAELLRRLEWHLSRFDGYVGVNNHMGSHFTSDEAGMAAVMVEVKARGLLYVDSRTTPDTVGLALARRFGVPVVERDVFLDDDQAPASVRRQLAVLEEEARRRGFAIAIGHPHPATLEALEAWLPEVEARGFVLAPVSAVVRRHTAPSPSAGRRLTLQ